MTAIQKLEKRVIQCEACPRLREYCIEVARTKRRAYLHDTYWGRPIPGFGDTKARLFIVGLAPAAHGANRTGRVFTGDRSGEWLYRALHKAGFASVQFSQGPGDGLKLQDAYISCVVKCAPPDNKPNPQELARCLTHLKDELSIMSQTRVWLTLGNIALRGMWPLIGESAPRPRFGHGHCIKLPGDRGWLLMSYHPSQQNTFTGRLTEPMFDAVFAKANALLDRSPTRAIMNR